ncbi:hypothetical protein TNCV_2647501 [Trichonephila clavipes]|nr:hypothetical protein TNCV_2647501 [Trichonephila clavipes]
MGHVDCLSRYPVMTITCDEITTKLANCQRNDEYINSLKTLLENKQINNFDVKNYILYKIENDNDVLVVPQQMQTEIVKNIHSKGHLGINKTESMVKQSFYFPNVRKCVENVIDNCIECILVNKKRGKGEGLLNPIPKENIPLSIYHIEFLGPLPSTNKNHNHILSIIDAFTKFVWIYPIKSTSSRDALEKLKQQEITFGNPHRIITDKGTAFTSKEFREYSIQRTINSSISRSTQKTPFQLLTGVKRRTKQDREILKLLEENIVEIFTEDREKIREETKRNNLKMQEENCRNFNKKRKKAYQYEIRDIVAIQRTQFGTVLKLRPKFFGPYEVVKVKPKDRYDVRKIGLHEGPNTTSTAADHMKMWGETV